MDVFEAVQDARAEHGVPGVTVGVWEDGAERHGAYGVTSIENPLDVTPDTRFQIGSITKTFLGTPVCQLAPRGRPAARAPPTPRPPGRRPLPPRRWVTYLPDLVLADAEATERVTMRHLLA